MVRRLGRGDDEITSTLDGLRRRRLVEIAGRETSGETLYRTTDQGEGALAERPARWSWEREEDHGPGLWPRSLVEWALGVAVVAGLFALMMLAEAVARTPGAP